MASIKRFKNEVDYLVSEVVSDCYTSLMINPSKSREQVLEIIETALNVRNDLFDKINKPSVDKNDAKAVRKYYFSLRENMFTAIDNLFTSLSNICKPE